VTRSITMWAYLPIGRGGISLWKKSVFRLFDMIQTSFPIDIEG